MNLREMIEAAADKTGGQKELAKQIGVTPDCLTHAKKGRRGLPNVSAAKLADLLGIDRFTVIAASELATEKDPEKIEYLRPFLHGVPKIAASWILAVFAAATASYTTEGSAATAARNDTLFVTSTSPEPAPLSQSHVLNTLYYVNAELRRD